MNLKKTLGLTVAATAIAASASFAPVATAVEVSASAGISNMYLWRGYNLAASVDDLGAAAFSGDITVSTGGFYGSIWASSGDSFAGTEYDLILGYGGESGDFSYGISLISYVYANDPGDTDIGDFVEAVINLGYGPLSFAYHDNIESEPGTYALGEEYSYFNIGYAINDSWSVAIGRHDLDQDGVPSALQVADTPTHLDISYAYNDNLSFTVSKLIADEEDSDDDALFAVSYSFPIE